MRGRSIHLVVRWGESVLVAGDFAPRRAALKKQLGTARCEEIAGVFDVDEGGAVRLGGKLLEKGEAVSEEVGPYIVEASLASDEPRVQRKKREKLPIAAAMISGVVHASLAIAGLMFMPALDETREAERSEDRVEMMRAINAAHPESEVMEGGAATDDESSDAGSATRVDRTERQPAGARAAVGVGRASRGHESGSGGLSTGSEDAASIDPSTFGMIGLLQSRATSGGGSSPWADFGGMSAPGRNLWGSEIGEDYSIGGIGLSGIGEPGGRSNGEIALEGISTEGNARFGGNGDGLSGGYGRLAGSHRTKPPRVCTGCGTSVSGRLPAEIIQRTVRMNFGRYRLCYENALKSQPTLSGRVAVRFIIGVDGSVTSTAVGDSNMPNEVSSCVVRAFGGLSFPAPEGGIVVVTYPITFSPE